MYINPSTVSPDFDVMTLGQGISPIYYKDCSHVLITANFNLDELEDRRKALMDYKFLIATVRYLYATGQFGETLQLVITIVSNLIDYSKEHRDMLDQLGQYFPNLSQAQSILVCNEDGELRLKSDHVGLMPLEDTVWELSLKTTETRKSRKYIRTRVQTAIPTDSLESYFSITLMLIEAILF